MQLGTLYGIGIGTGDPELITVKGWRRLQETPVIAFPSGLNQKPGLAESIIQPWLKPEQTQLALEFPYLQDETLLKLAWRAAANRVWYYLSHGENVAFACEGDVSFYSTFNYLAQTLQQIHPEVLIEIIPGIASPMAAAAVLGIPLATRHQRLTILPALYHIDRLQEALDCSEVVILMKVSSVYEQVWQVLKERNLLDHAFLVERATLPNQKVYTNLSDRPQLSLSYFSLLIIQPYPNQP